MYIFFVCVCVCLSVCMYIVDEHTPSHNKTRLLKGPQMINIHTYKIHIHTYIQDTHTYKNTNGTRIQRNKNQEYNGTRSKNEEYLHERTHKARAPALLKYTQNSRTPRRPRVRSQTLCVCVCVCECLCVCVPTTKEDQGSAHAPTCRMDSST